MKVEGWLFMAGVPAFVAMGVGYGIMTDWNEPVGTSCLFLTAGMALMIGAYLFYTAKTIDDRPEDDPFGQIAQGAGELGEFAPFSWWPLAVAAGGAVLFAGLAVGWWLFLIGLVMSALGLVGWVFEFYRGEHAH